MAQENLLYYGDHLDMLPGYDGSDGCGAALQYGLTGRVLVGRVLP